MTNKKAEETRIVIRGSRAITRRDLFKKKEEFHKEQAKLPFEEKIKILIRLQKIVNSIQKGLNKKHIIWEIPL